MKNPPFYSNIILSIVVHENYVHNHRKGDIFAMAKDKKLVEAITAMEDDFAQWYTDVVKKAELADYSSVRGCMI